MESRIYTCEVTHHRLEPKRNKFAYKMFMFYLDLDELDFLHKKLRLLSLNAFNLFAFHQKDHANFPDQQSERNSSVKEKITEFIEKEGIPKKEICRIGLLTNLNTAGYLFNPVSFYYCFDEKEQPLCAVAEVCNTFREMKLYFLGKNTLSEGRFTLYTLKNFYVSPFSELDTSFKFILIPPQEKLLARVDDYKNNTRFLLSSLSGERKTLSDANLLYSFVCFPFITLQIILLIYWQAFLLYLKKVPFIKKKEHPELQQDLVKLT